MRTKGGGGAAIVHKARLLIACGGRGRREQLSLSYIHLKCMKISLSPISYLSYLRFAEAVSFDKKSYVGAVHNQIQRRDLYLDPDPQLEKFWIRIWIRIKSIRIRNPAPHNVLEK